MLLEILAVIAGLAVLVWSADRFVDGAAATAKHLGMPALLIGMVIIGFGTSAPEIVVSVMASIEGKPGLALGNAYGSNISNIGLVLGATALLAPILVESQVLKKEIPILLFTTVVAGIQLLDGELSRLDGIVLLVLFAGLMGWSIAQGVKSRNDALAEEVEREIESDYLAIGPALTWLIVGLVLLVVSSRLLVWGATELATAFGVSELIVGLTIVAIGTSLPELASSIAASRKGEQDLAIGNVMGSNLFNTLAVVGLAGTIHPLEVESMVVYRDISVMAVMGVMLMVFAFGFRNKSTLTKQKGFVLLLAWVAYMGFLLYQQLGGLA